MDVILEEDETDINDEKRDNENSMTDSIVQPKKQIIKENKNHLDENKLI